MGDCKYAYFGRKGDKQSARDVVWIFCVQRLKYEFFILIIWYVPNQKCITLTVTEIMVTLNIWPWLKHLHVFPCLQPFIKMSSYIIINILHPWHAFFLWELGHPLFRPHQNPQGYSCPPLGAVVSRRWTSWQIFIPSEKLGSASGDWQWFIQE